MDEIAHLAFRTGSESVVHRSGIERNNPVGWSRSQRDRALSRDTEEGLASGATDRILNRTDPVAIATVGSSRTDADEVVRGV